ncbi:SRPBCC family protein [Euzebya sp.]|uniref:SRPBCC family protein n=1 Tax=Euzebya sp. TaxID=1971409 RepID=UPI003513DB17
MDTAPTGPDASMATVVRADGRTGLRFERHLAHPPEKVWRAITESAHLRSWFPADIVGERRPGAAIELPFWPDHVEAHDIADPVLSGEIRVWDPPREFTWTWDGDLLHWQLTSEGDGTRLTFTTWPADQDDHPALSDQAAGYHVCLDHLEVLLDGGDLTPLAAADPSPLEVRYAALLDSTG